MSAPRPVIGVGVVCFRGDEVLLVRRGKPPREGEWSLPGGRLEWGETVRDGALRELREETGVRAEIVGLIDVVDGLFPGDGPGGLANHYVLVDFAARWLEGEPVGGDDAADARFVAMDAALRLVNWPETQRVIREAWGFCGR
jgi:8-oxo-dGTP diphosphatase